jgi:hypothetical protein
MGITVYNPQKGRLETIYVEFTQENTTWFEKYRSPRDIWTITDFEGGILIREFDYTHLFWIYDVSRADIGYDQKKAKQLRRQYE